MFHFFNVVEPHLDNQCQATEMFLYDQWGSKINRVFRYVNECTSFCWGPKKSIQIIRSVWLYELDGHNLIKAEFYCSRLGTNGLVTREFNKELDFGNSGFMEGTRWVWQEPKTN